MKKLLVIAVSLCLVFGVCAGAFAASGKNAKKADQDIGVADVLSFLTGKTFRDKDVKKYIKDFDEDDFDDLLDVAEALCADEEPGEDDYEELGIEDAVNGVAVIAYLLGNDILDENDLEVLELEDAVDLVEILGFIFDRDDLDDDYFEDLDLDEADLEAAFEGVKILDLLHDADILDESMLENIEIDEVLGLFEIIGHLFDIDKLDEEELEGLDLGEADLEAILEGIMLLDYLYDEDYLNEGVFDIHVEDALGRLEFLGNLFDKDTIGEGFSDETVNYDFEEFLLGLQALDYLFDEDHLEEEDFGDFASSQGIHFFETIGHFIDEDDLDELDKLDFSEFFKKLDTDRFVEVAAILNLLNDKGLLEEDALEDFGGEDILDLFVELSLLIEE